MIQPRNLPPGSPHKLCIISITAIFIINQFKLFADQDKQEHCSPLAKTRISDFYSISMQLLQHLIRLQQYYCLGIPDH